MQSDGCGSVHQDVPTGLWVRGFRRGSYEAVIWSGTGPTRKREQRCSLGTSSEQEADDLIKRMNDDRVAGGPVTVASCFALYKFHKEQKGKWTQSMERARRIIVEQIGHMRPDDLSKRFCESMVEKRLTAAFAPDTVRIEMAYLRAAVKHAEREKKLVKAPFIYVPPGGAPRERWLTEDEVDRLLDGAIEPHVRLFIILAVTTAARPSHILGLKWTAIDFENLVVDFRHEVVVNGKKHRPRVRINDTCLHHLQEAWEMHQTEFVIEFRGKGGFKKIYKGVTEAARRAGVEGMSPYVLRHTAGVWMARAGVPMQEIAAFMGHKNLKTTMDHYAHFHPEFMQRSAAALELKGRNGPRKAMVHDGPGARTLVEHMVQSDGPA
jgi:integrase